MIAWKQKQYEQPADPSAHRTEALVVHRQDHTPEAENLVLFVHGLGGSRYGTWKLFPQFVFEDFPDADVGLYQFTSALGRWRIWESVDLDAEARAFAGMLRDRLKQYKQITLIGHSMGGLLCKSAIHYLVTEGDSVAIERISGLILMATPQLGSRWITPLIGRFLPDGRALRVHGQLMTEVQTTFANKIAVDEGVHTRRKITIPTWAVLGVNDYWVDPLSARIGLTSARVLSVRGMHTSIVKPKTKESDVYPFVRDAITKSFHRFEYDVFVAAPMAAFGSDREYQANRADVLRLLEALQASGFKALFYAGEKFDSIKSFDLHALALVDDIAALRQSRYFLLYYPQKIASSVIFEAGWALIMGKPAVYIVRDDKDLPFLMKDASQAFDTRQVRIVECGTIDIAVEQLRTHGVKLFRDQARTQIIPT
jgi:pimeloyl-ACP methyl ester carboxylesterase